MTKPTQYGFILGGQPPVATLPERACMALIELYGLIHSLENPAVITAASEAVKRHGLSLQRVSTEQAQHMMEAQNEIQEQPKKESKLILN